MADCDWIAERAGLEVVRGSWPGEPKPGDRSTCEVGELNFEVFMPAGVEADLLRTEAVLEPGVTWKAGGATCNPCTGTFLVGVFLGVENTVFWGVFWGDREGALFIFFP